MVTYYGFQIQQLIKFHYKTYLSGVVSLRHSIKSKACGIKYGKPEISPRKNLQITKHDFTHCFRLENSQNSDMSCSIKGLRSYDLHLWCMISSICGGWSFKIKIWVIASDSISVWQFPVYRENFPPISILSFKFKYIYKYMCTKTVHLNLGKFNYMQRII